MQSQPTTKIIQVGIAPSSLSLNEQSRPLCGDCLYQMSWNPKRNRFYCIGCESK